MRLRTPNEQDLERRKRTAKIRTAARKGKSQEEIAELHQLPLAAVKRILAPIEHPRISDPVQLLRSHRSSPGTAPGDIQMYWLGFLMAAGHIWGQGSSLTLVLTLGKESRVCVQTFIADLATDYIRCEFCHSSTVGWQVYLRDQNLCKALFPWGIPSELHGDDSALLDDLPGEFAVPFIRGYLDGNWPATNGSNGARVDRLTLQGTPAVLARLNSMIQRYWGGKGGMVTSRRERAELKFLDPRLCRTIHGQLNTFVSRARP